MFAVGGASISDGRKFDTAGANEAQAAKSPLLAKDARNGAPGVEWWWDWPNAGRYVPMRLFRGRALSLLQGECGLQLNLIRGTADEDFECAWVGGPIFLVDVVVLEGAGI